MKNYLLYSKDKLIDCKLERQKSRIQRHKRKYKKQKPKTHRLIPVHLYSTIWFYRMERKYTYKRISELLWDGWKVKVTPTGISKLIKRIQRIGGLLDST